MLQRQLTEVTETIARLGTKKESRSRETGKVEAAVRHTANELYDVFLTLKIATEAVLQSLFPDHDEILETYDTWLTLIDEQPIPDDRLPADVHQLLTELEDSTNADLAKVKYLGNTLPKRISQKIEKAQAESDRVQQTLVRLMSRFRSDFPAETADLSDNMQDAAQYEGYYNRCATPTWPGTKPACTSYCKRGRSTTWPCFITTWKSTKAILPSGSCSSITTCGKLITTPARTLN